MFDNLHLFLSRYKWYNRLMFDTPLLSCIFLIVICAFGVVLISLSASALKYGILMGLSLIVSWLAFMKMKQNEIPYVERLLKIVVYLYLITFALMTVRFLGQI